MSHLSHHKTWTSVRIRVAVLVLIFAVSGVFLYRTVRPRDSSSEVRHWLIHYDAAKDAADSLPGWDFSGLLEAISMCADSDRYYDVRVLAWSEGTIEYPKLELTQRSLTAAVYFTTESSGKSSGVVILQYGAEQRRWLRWLAGRHDCPCIVESKSGIKAKDVYRLWSKPVIKESDRNAMRITTKKSFIRRNTWIEVFGEPPVGSYEVPH